MPTLLPSEVRREALDQAIRVAIECGEMNADSILEDADKFSQFIIDGKRADA